MGGFGSIVDVLSGQRRGWWPRGGARECPAVSRFGVGPVPEMPDRGWRPVVGGDGRKRGVDGRRGLVGRPGGGSVGATAAGRQGLAKSWSGRSLPRVRSATAWPAGPGPRRTARDADRQLCGNSAGGGGSAAYGRAGLESAARGGSRRAAAARGNHCGSRPSPWRFNAVRGRCRSPRGRCGRRGAAGSRRVRRWAGGVCRRAAPDGARDRCRGWVLLLRIAPVVVAVGGARPPPRVAPVRASLAPASSSRVPLSLPGRTPAPPQLNAVQPPGKRGPPHSRGTFARLVGLRRICATPPEPSSSIRSFHRCGRVFRVTRQSGDAA